MRKEPEPGLETLLTHCSENRAANYGAAVAPIFQNSLFTFESWEAIDRAFDDRVSNCIYSRGRNPTVSSAEAKIARMASGEDAKLFGSGMAAISAALLHYLEYGDHVVTLKNIYGPTNTLLNQYLRRKMNIDVTFIDGVEMAEFEDAIRSNTRVIYLECPTSAIFTLQDIRAVTRLARARGIHTIIDNSWATPVFQKPLTMGADMEVHSCSKYLGGHSDLIAGVVIGNKQDITAISVNEYEILGGVMSPFEAWLIMRSLRTLPLRMLKHQENALQVAQFLQGHPKVRQVRYPGLETSPQYELGKKQMCGYSGLFSFELVTADLEAIKKFVNSLNLFQIGVSWGGHESLVYPPAISYSKELPVEQFKAMGISFSDIRLSVGLENSQDLIDDLQSAFEHIN